MLPQFQHKAQSFWKPCVFEHSIAKGYSVLLGCQKRGELEPGTEGTPLVNQRWWLRGGIFSLPGSHQLCGLRDPALNRRLPKSSSSSWKRAAPISPPPPCRGGTGEQPPSPPTALPLLEQPCSIPPACTARGAASALLRVSACSQPQQSQKSTITKHPLTNGGHQCPWQGVPSAEQDRQRCGEIPLQPSGKHTVFFRSY